jgi:hypothetical protein
LRKLINTEAWAKDNYTQLVNSIQEYVDRHQTDTTWMVSRLQMYWKTKSLEAPVCCRIRTRHHFRTPFREAYKEFYLLKGKNSIRINNQTYTGEKINQAGVPVFRFILPRIAYSTIEL